MAKRRYYKLVIVASTPLTEIWIGDDGGHLVQKEIGELHASFLPGRYIVSFGLTAPAYPVDLTKPRHFTQSQLESGPTCERPIPRLLPADSVIEQDAPLTEAQRLEAERRLLEYEANPERYSTWEEVKRRLGSKRWPGR